MRKSLHVTCCVLNRAVSRDGRPGKQKLSCLFNSREIKVLKVKRNGLFLVYFSLFGFPSCASNVKAPTLTPKQQLYETPSDILLPLSFTLPQASSSNSHTGAIIIVSKIQHKDLVTLFDTD